MHELAIANSILDAVRQEVAPYPGARPLKVTVRIGPLAGIEPRSLAFCYQVLVRGTDFESMELLLEDAPADELALSSLELEEPS